MAKASCSDNRCPKKGLFLCCANAPQPKAGAFTARRTNPKSNQPEFRYLSSVKLVSPGVPALEGKIVSVRHCAALRGRDFEYLILDAVPLAIGHRFLFGLE